MSETLVGNAAARQIHGFSAGADCVLLGSDANGRQRWTTALSEVCRPAVLHGATSLLELARIAERGTGPLVVVDAALELGMPGTLDLLDMPTDPTAALVAEPRNIEAPRQAEHGLELATPARVDADGKLIGIGRGGQPHPGPDRLILGLLRIAAGDRERAAALWRDLAGREAGKGADPDPGRDRDREQQAESESAPGSALFDRAVAGLLTGDLVVRARSLGYYTWRRGEAGQTGLGRSAWQQRLRSASRLGDGAYSAAVVRPLSRIGTRLGLRIGLTPNVVTMISLAVGVIAGLLVFTGSYPLWVLAAVLLQLALVIDCMDGEIARFTRRFSAFGGWLDGIGDRVKEYLIFAAVAAVAVRQGHPDGWLLAMIAMVIVTARHLEDYAYTDRSAAIRAGARPGAMTPPPDTVRPPDITGPSDIARSGATANIGNGLRAPASRNQRIVFWGKKIAHVPIAERYLILSLGLLTGRPIWVLAAAIVVSAFALLWVVGGRVLRAIRSPHPPANPTLDQQLDLGRLARLAGRGRIGDLLGQHQLTGLVLLVVCWLACILGICARWWPLSLLMAALAVVLAGAALREPSRHRFGWLALPVVWAGESAVIGSVMSQSVPGWSVPGGLLFGVLAAVAYRRYELIYSLRLTGARGPAAVLGFDGRILVVAVLVAAANLTPGATGGHGVLLVGLILLGGETLLEAVVGTVRRWRRRSDAAV